MELNDSELKTRPDNSRLFFSAIARGKYDLLEQADQTILEGPGVYCIFNSESNMLYIGCSMDIKKRIGTHKTHLSKGVHVCRLMSDHYAKNQDSFQFFPIAYVDESNFSLPESIRNHLFALEMQHMKRVPLAALYNALMPASLSEKMLLSEQPKKPQGIPITQIINRLGMSVDSIKSNGFTPIDILEHDAAIEFLQKRTVANGRFPEEKAAIAREFLAELQALSPSKTDESESLLIRGGVMDYFEGVEKTAPALFEKVSFKGWRKTLFVWVAFTIVMSHAALVWYDMHLLWSTPGKIGGGVIFAFIFGGMVLMSEKDAGMTAIRENMLWSVGALEALAIVVHRGAFSRNAAQAYAAGFGVEYIWALAAVICLCSIGATIFYQKVIQ